MTQTKSKGGMRRLARVKPNCAGTDIGKENHCVALDPECFAEPLSYFGTPARDLAATESTSACRLRRSSILSARVFR